MDAKHILLSLLEYNAWATEHVLRQVEKLTEEQLHTPVTISHGSAFDLVRHMLDTEWSWRLFASGGPGQKYLWEVEDLSELPIIRKYWQAEHARMLEYVRSLPAADLEREVDYGTAQGGLPRFSKVWQIIVHVVSHSTHHRSEMNRCLLDFGHPVDEQRLDYGSFVARWGG